MKVEASNDSSVAMTVEAPNFNKSITSNEQPAAEVRAVVAAISRHLGTCDDDLGLRLITDSRAKNPHVALDELLCWIDLTLPDLCRNGRIDSKAGVLLSRANMAFSGEGYAFLQAMTSKWQKAKAEGIMRTYSAASLEDRRWAESILFPNNLADTPEH